MPTYNQPPRVVPKEEAEQWIAKTYNKEHKNLVRVQWLFGKRPIETVSLTKDNFDIDGDVLRLHFIGKKRVKKKGIIGINQKFITNEVSISRDPFVKELSEYIVGLKDGQRLFSFKSPTRIKQLIYALTACGKCPDCLAKKKCKTSIPPYFTRHSRKTQLGRIGGSAKDLADWDGVTLSAVEPYLIREPVTKFKGKID